MSLRLECVDLRFDLLSMRGGDGSSSSEYVVTRLL